MSLEKNTIIGSYKKFNGDELLIEFKNIYNLYSVYIPEKKMVWLLICIIYVLVMYVLYFINGF